MRKNSMAVGAAAMAAVVYACAAGAQSSLDPQLRIARDLGVADPASKLRAAEAAVQIPPERRGTALRQALIAALQEETSGGIARYKAERRGERVKIGGNPELLSRLMPLVAELRDSTAVPALTATLGNGFTIVWALADFGQTAAPAVLEVVTSPASTVSQIDHGLITLRFMVEDRGRRPLSPATLQRIRAAAAMYLEPKRLEFLPTLWWAIDLAGVLNDSSLNKTLKSIASNPGAMTARGITEVDLVAQTRKRAADRLAGSPPLPRRPANR